MIFKGLTINYKISSGGPECQSQFNVKDGKKLIMNSYWFEKQGNSEGPEGFQTDSK